EGLHLPILWLGGVFDGKLLADSDHLVVGLLRLGVPPQPPLEDPHAVVSPAHFQPDGRRRTVLLGRLFVKRQRQRQQLPVLPLPLRGPREHFLRHPQIDAVQRLHRQSQVPLRLLPLLGFRPIGRLGFILLVLGPRLLRQQ